MRGGAYQQALAYARDRRQGRGTEGASAPVAIIEHADVRRMLLSIRTFVDAARALVGWCALQVDRARHHPDPAERARAGDVAALLTPVVKAGFTDMGFESAVAAQQIFGGHGYIRAWGMEQYVRDVRIAQIYEGTNGIQAMDLVNRKLPLEGGAVVSRFFATLESELRSAAGLYVADRTLAALGLLRATTAQVRGAPAEIAGAVAVDYSRLFALILLGWMWSRMAAAATSEPALAVKLATADFFARRILSQADGLAAGIAAAIEGGELLAAADF